MFLIINDIYWLSKTSSQAYDVYLINVNKGNLQKLPVIYISM